MKKRVMSVFLALALCLTLLPVPAWADEDTHMHAGTGDSVYTVKPDTAAQSVENNVAVQTNTANVAEVTAADDTVIGTYDSLNNAITAAQAATGATTVKLLTNVTTTSAIVVNSGTFTLDLNGMNWNRSSNGYTLWVQENGNVTVTSTQNTGTISNTGGGTAINVAAGATVHVTNRVRLNQLYAMDTANLTLDVGVIITDTLHVKNGNIAPFLTGKALQACDADGNTTENTYAPIYNKNYDTGHESTGCVIVIEHKSCAGTPSQDDPCTICGYDGTQTKPTEPEDDPDVAEIKDTGTKYKTLAAAIAAANGAEIKLLKIFGENVVVNDENSKASIILGTGGTIEDGGKKCTYPSNWMAMQTSSLPRIPLTMNAGEITLKEGVLAQFCTGSNNNIAIELNGGTLTVADTVTKIIGGSVDITSENTAQMAAIEATGGVLDLQGNTHLDGGLSISGDAQLAHKLTAGIFTNSGSTTASVSVEGDTTSYPPVPNSTEYSTVFDLLAEGYAFAKYDTSKENNAGEIVNGYVNKITEDVIVVAHPEHTMTNGVCACGFTCTAHHFEGGKCSVCGYECTHPSATEADGKYTCDTCKQQVVVKVEKGDKITYYAERHNAYNDETLWWLFNNALESDSTVTLLADNLVAWAYVSNGKQITLDLNGKTLDETSQGITVGQGDQEDTTTNNKLIVKGTLGAGEVAEDNNYAFRTWVGGELALEDFEGGGKIGGIIADGGKVTTGSSNTDITIGTLDVNNGDTELSFSTGTFDKICFSSIREGSVKLGDLLALAEDNLIQKSGKAFKHTGEGGAFVPYDTVIDSNNAVENVTITDCPHNSIESESADGITYGTCSTCGMTGIAAVLTKADGSIKTYTINSGTGEIFGGLKNDGGTLKLYRDLTCNETLGTEGGTTEMVIDLNGHEIKLPDGAANQEVTFNGGSLTITDSSSGKSGSFSATLRVYYTASLTVDGVKMGTIGLQSETASITLKEGTTFTGYEKPSGTMLAQWIEDENCISGLSSSIDNYTDKSESGSFAVEKAPAAFSTSVKSGTIRYNGLMPEEVIPGITLDAGSNVSSVDMRWYYSKGGSFNMMNQNGTIYPNAPASTWRGYVKSDVFNKFKIGDTISDVFCVLYADDGSWRTVLRGYTFTLAGGDLSEATVNATNLDSLVYTPDGYGSSMSQQLQFTVTRNNGTTLTGGTHYRVKDNSDTADTAGEHTLVLEGLGNYAGSTLEYKWTVKPLTLGTLAEQSSIEKNYDGTANLPSDFVFTPYFDVNNSWYALNSSDYTVEGSYDSAAVGENKTVTFQVTLTSENYTFANGAREATFTAKGEIIKASAPAAQEGALTIVNHHTDSYEFGLSGLLPALENGREYGTISYGEPVINLNSGYYTSGAAIDANGVLTLPVQKNETNQEGAVGTVTILVTSTNYEDFALTINVSATNKIVPTGAPTLSKTTLTYGEKLSSITLSGAMQDGEATVQGTFAWTQPDAAPAAGSYAVEWKFTPADSSKYMEITGTVDITVNKATPSGAPKYTAVNTSGKTLADAALAVNDSWPDGTVKWVDANGNALELDTEVKANTAYKWVFTPTDADNYNEISGSITLYSVSTGGGGGGSTTTSTETTTNPDGSTTKTETKSDGTVVETTTNKDGSTTKTESKTETKSDGSTVETVTETRTEADGSKTTGKTETVTAKDGTKTETKSETTTAKDGSKTETKSETKTDANGVTSGTETSKSTAANGSTGTTTTVIENGVSKTEAEAKISDKAVSDAKKSDEAVKIPTEVKAGGDSASAPTVKIDLPKNSGETKIEIPVKDVSAGTVAVIVHPDGTEELIKESLPTEGGVQLTVDGSVTVKIVDNAKDFKDTKNHWAADSIDFVSARGLVNGTGGDSFDPNAASTRAQLWTILARRIGADLTGGASWYEKAQEWAKTNGISDGSNPDSSITRAQMVTMLWRAAGSPKADGANAFNDVPTGSYYADAIAWAAAHGITTGVGNGAFDPNGTCTRAQIAAFLHRSYLSE